MLRKGIKFSIQRVYFQQSYLESRHYGKRFNSIGKFKSLTFQLRAIFFHTLAVDMSVYVCIVAMCARICMHVFIRIRSRFRSLIVLRYNCIHYLHFRRVQLLD